MAGWFGRAVLLSFWIFSAWYLYIGGILTSTLNFVEAITAICLANIFFILIFTFYAGTNKPKDALFQEAFGMDGARYCISLLPTLSQIGWYAVVVEIGGTALALAMGFSRGSFLFYLLLCGYGAITIWFALGGLRRISKLSYFSAPAMLGFLIWGTYAVFSRLGIAGLFNFEPIHGNHNILGGIQLAIASFVSAAVTIPDFLHDLGTKRKVFLASFVGLLPTALLVGGMGSAFAIIGKSYDVIATLQMMGGPLFVYTLLSIDNLCGAQAVYPVGIGLVSVFANENKAIKEKGRKLLTIAGGLVSIALAIIGVVGKLELWLTILGTVFPPIIGVVLANQYFVKYNFSNKKAHFPALLAWALGSGVALVPVGIPAIQAMLASLLMFVILARKK